MVKTFGRYAFNPPKRFMAFTIMISGQHFIPYAREVAKKVEREMQNARPVSEAELVAVSVAH